MICFLTTGIDHLVLHDTLISKNAMHRVVAPIVKVFADVGAVVAQSTQVA
jgi:carbamoyltransferase